MKNKTLYIIISVLLLLNIGQFVYFYSKDSDLNYEEEFNVKLHEYGKRNDLTKEEIEIINFIIYNSIDKEQAINDIKKKLDENFTCEPVVNSKLGFIAWCNIQKPPLIPDPANPWSEEPVPGTSIVDKIGLTKDGKLWVFDDTKSSFVPF
jgi:hypothetical protein